MIDSPPPRFEGAQGYWRSSDGVAAGCLTTLWLAPEAAHKSKAANELPGSKGLLRAGTAVDGTLIAAPSSTMNQSGEHDPEMHQSICA